MFGKLLKNDLKAQWHSVSTIYLVSFVIAAVAECGALFSKSQTTAALSGFLVILVFAFTSLVSLIAVAMMFSNTLFGRAGYLTLTLPVKTGSLIRSKTLSGLIWIFVSYALLIGSMLLWVEQVQNILGDSVTSSAEDLLALLGIPSIFTMVLTLVVMCISFAAVILLLVQCLYLAISLSNVSPLSKLGNFGAVVMFFVIFGVVYSLTVKAGGLWKFGVVISDSAMLFTNDVEAAGGSGFKVELFGTVLRAAAAIGLHYPITAIVKNKVNIK